MHYRAFSLETTLDGIEAAWVSKDEMTSFEGYDRARQHSRLTRHRLSEVSGQQSQPVTRFSPRGRR